MFDRSHITWCHRFSRISRDQTVCNVLTRLLGFTVPLVFNGSRKLIGCQLPVFATLYECSSGLLVLATCTPLIGVACISGVVVRWRSCSLPSMSLLWDVIGQMSTPLVTFSCNSSFVLISLVIVIVM